MILLGAALKESHGWEAIRQPQIYRHAGDPRRIMEKRSFRPKEKARSQNH